MAEVLVERTWKDNVNAIVSLLVGVFGALAIIGVLMKVAKFDNWETFMAIGFIGEAAAFVIMGVMGFIGARARGTYIEDDVVGPVDGQGFLGYGSPELADELHSSIKDQVKLEVSRIMGTLGEDLEAVSARLGEDSAAFSNEFRTAIMEQVAPQMANQLGQITHQMNEAMAALGEDVQRVNEEMRSMSSEMELARGAVGTMREQLMASANGNLPEDAAKLGNGMRVLSEEMSEAGTAAETIRDEMEQMVNRFRAFNGGSGLMGNGQAEHTAASSVSS